MEQVHLSYERSRLATFISQVRLYLTFEVVLSYYGILFRQVILANFIATTRLKCRTETFLSDVI